MLEPDAGKLASPVLRGLGGSNAPRLPGFARVVMKYAKANWRYRRKSRKFQCISQLLMSSAHLKRK